MEIVGRLQNADGSCSVSLQTGGVQHHLQVEAKPDGQGVGTNGGEFLCAALATCYCNDLYREAAPRGIAIDSVSVEVTATFADVGEPAKSIEYSAHITGQSSEQALRDLALHTDRVAEIQNTLRQGMPVLLAKVSVEAREGGT